MSTLLQPRIKARLLIVRSIDEVRQLQMLSHSIYLIFDVAPQVSSLPVWRDRIRRLATDPVVMRSSLTTNRYVVHCWLITPNKLNLLSWLLAYLSDK